MSDLVGFRGDFVNIERHNGYDWIMVGEKFIARVVDRDRIEVFWAAYNRGLAVAREVGRQGI